jgi:hypothetical protein
MLEPDEELERILAERRAEVPPGPPPALEEDDEDPELGEQREPLHALEEALAQGAGDELRELALAVAAQAVATAAPFRERAAEDAAAYVASFPMPGKPLGDVDERAARWLAERYGTPARRARVARAVAVLADSALPDFPRAAAALAAVDEDELWSSVARAIVADRPR